MSELAISRGGRASSPATPATASPSARQSGRERPPRATGTNRNVSRKRRRNGSCTSRECSPRWAEESSARRGDAARRRSANSSSIGTSPQGIRQVPLDMTEASAPTPRGGGGRRCRGGGGPPRRKTFRPPHPPNRRTLRGARRPLWPGSFPRRPGCRGGPPVPAPGPFPGRNDPPPQDSGSYGIVYHRRPAGDRFPIDTGYGVSYSKSFTFRGSACFVHTSVRNPPGGAGCRREPGKNVDSPAFGRDEFVSSPGVPDDVGHPLPLSGGKGPGGERHLRRRGGGRMRPLRGARHPAAGQGVPVDVRPGGPRPRRIRGPRTPGGRPRYRFLRRGGDRGGGYLPGAGGARPSGQGAVPGGLPGNLSALRRGQEPLGVRLSRRNEPRAVRRLEDHEERKGVSDAESETTRFQVPP